MDRARKDMSGFAAVTVTASFKSLMLMNPASQVLRSNLLKWLITARGKGYRQNTKERYKHSHQDLKKLSPRRVTSSPVAHVDMALICELDEQ